MRDAKAAITATNIFRQIQTEKSNPQNQNNHIISPNDSPKKLRERKIRMKHTFLFTGVTGYLGSKIIHRLKHFDGTLYCTRRKFSNTYRVKDLDSRITWIDLEDFKFDEFFQKNRIDCIIHCATDYGRKVVDPLQLIEANLTLPLKLLHHGSISGVRCFINTDTVLDKKIGTYSLSKKQFLDWLERYSNEISTINVALQHFYGPDDDPTKFTTNIIKALINSAPIIKLTPGEQRRDFIYIDDVVEAFMKIIELSVDMQPGHHEFEVGTNSPVRIRDFVELAKSIAQNTETTLDFGALPYRQGELMDIKTNSAKLEGLGWKRRFTLEQGLSVTIATERSS